jgi:hypothetical protein
MKKRPRRTNAIRATALFRRTLQGKRLVNRPSAGNWWSGIFEGVPQSKSKYWSKLIAEQEAGGHKVRPFCRERGIGEPSFYYWRKRLRKSDTVRFLLLETTPAARLRSAGIDTLLLREKDRGAFSIAREWTDWADPSPYGALGLPQRRLDADSLFELAALLDQLV